jgi:predicted ATPase
MIRRLYIHNYGCLLNFKLPILGHSSSLLIGKNGSGKTTVGNALRLLQKIARGINQVKELVSLDDFSHGISASPMRFEIEVELKKMVCEYVLAFEYVQKTRQLLVFEEKFTVDGQPRYTRDDAREYIAEKGRPGKNAFRIDKSLVSLPIVQADGAYDPLFLFRRWLAQMLILKPVPSLIQGDSSQESLLPEPDIGNYGDWFSGLLAYSPSSYTKIAQYLQQVLPDLKDIKNPNLSANYRSLQIQFSNESGNLTLPFHALSDGEKCFLICGLVLAANDAYGPLFCFWDEPDNYLAIDEVEHFVMALRRTFLHSGGQFVATSHNAETIRCFSNENTLLLHRKNHLEPTTIHPLSEVQVNGDLVNALIRGDVLP